MTQWTMGKTGRDPCQPERSTINLAITIRFVGTVQTHLLMSTHKHINRVTHLPAPKKSGEALFSKHPQQQKTSWPCQYIALYSICVEKCTYSSVDWTVLTSVYLCTVSNFSITTSKGLYLSLKRCDYALISIRRLHVQYTGLAVTKDTHH